MPHQGLGIRGVRTWSILQEGREHNPALGVLGPALLAIKELHIREGRTGSSSGSLSAGHAGRVQQAVSCEDVPQARQHIGKGQRLGECRRSNRMLIVCGLCWPAPALDKQTGRLPQQNARPLPQSAVRQYATPVLLQHVCLPDLSI